MAITEVVVGQVVKAHGVRGEVVVELHTDEPKKRFHSGAVLRVDSKGPGQWYGRAVTVDSARPQRDRWVLRLRESATRDYALGLVGAWLRAEVDDRLRPDDPAEFYDRDLIGLTVKLPDLTAVGRVTDVIHGAAQDVLVIETAGGERLVPFVEALVPAVDVPRGSIMVDAIPGLLTDVDEPEA